MTCRRILPGLLFWLAVAPVAEAQVFESYHFDAVNLSVPDADEAGVSDTRTLTSAITSIGDVNVTLNIAGRGGAAFNGDLYVTLTHSSGYSVLLNRTGRRTGNVVGYGDNGFDVTLDDQAANGDVHQYRLTLNGNQTTSLGGALTGIWAPDGRSTDPDLVLTTNPRSQFLDGFNHLAASGTWTLFVADLETGGTARLISWALDITNVPEPGLGGLASAGGLFGLVAWRRLRRRTGPARA